MRILVSFKVTPDFEALREAEWADGAANGVETRYVPRILNCFDESALEMALRMAETLGARGIAASLGAVSVGGAEVESYLKTLYALGYERAARVSPEANLDFAPAVTAALIAAYARQADHSDLLLLGSRSDPGDSGVVPFLVAESLGWPCVTQVTEIEPLSDDRLRVACLVDDGLLRLTLRLPCVLAVGNAAVSHLRVPTLTNRLAHRDKLIDVVAPADLGVEVAAELGRATPTLVGLEMIDRARRGLVVSGETARAKAQTLFDDHLRRILVGL
jgi:electron transfer flavoprotein alpha/beta subunit